MEMKRFVGLAIVLGSADRIVTVKEPTERIVVFKHFKDLDLKAIHQEYLTRFLELDYNLDDHGVFVYPEVS
jgi:hypothetical protein